MFCKNCGFENENNSGFCGQCGAKLGEEVLANEVESPVAEATEAPANEVDETVAAEAPVAAEPETNTEVPAPKKKGFKFKKWMAITAAAVVVVAIALGIFWRPVVNTLMNIAPAQTHLKWVYANATSDLGESFTGRYDKGSSYFLDGFTTDLGVEVALESTVKTLIKQALGTDLPLDSAAINMSLTYDADGAAGFDLELKLNDDSIISGYAAFDYNEMVASVSLPDLTEEALVFDLNDVLSADQLDEFASMEFDTVYTAVEDMLPDAKLVEDLLVRYAKVAVDSVEDVERSSGDYEIGGVSADATCFEVEISEETGLNMLLAILEEAKEDDDIIDYIGQVIEAVTDISELGMSGAEMDAESIEKLYSMALKNAIRELKSKDADRETLATLYTYVNGSGEILAIEVKLEGTDEGFIAGTAKEGNEIAYGAYAYGSRSVGIIAEGEGSADNFKGELKLLDGKTEGGTKIAELVDFDFESLSNGYINGKVNFEVPNPLLGSGTIVIETTFESDEDSFKAVAAIESIATITITSEVKSSDSVDVVTDGVDDPEEWLQSLDADALLKKLEAIGLDEKLLEKIDLSSLMGAAGNKQQEEVTAPTIDRYDYNTDYSNGYALGDY